MASLAAVITASRRRSAGRRPVFSPADFSPREMAALLRLAGPIAAVGLLNMGMSVTDVIMVGWLGSGSLAAVAVMSDAYSIVFYVGAGILAAVAPLVAEARGAGRERAARQAVRHGIWVAAMVALPAGALVWAAPTVLAAIGVDGAIIDTGRPYAHYMAGTMVLMMPVVLWRHVLSAFERPRVFMLFSLAALPLNGLGNYLLMFGAFGLPEMGLAGTAASSLIVAAMLSLGLGAYVAWAPSLRRYQLLSRPLAVAPARLAHIVRIGLPIGISSLAEVGVFLTSTIVIAMFPAESVAAHLIALRIAGIAYAPVMGLGQAATVRTAHAIGAGDGERLRRCIATALVGGGALGAALLTVLYGAADVLPWLFLSAADPAAAAVAPMAASLLVMLAICEVSQGPVVATLGVLRGYKDTRVPMFVTLASNWVAGFGSGMVLAFGLGLGPVGVWAGLVVGSSVAAAGAYMRLSRLAS